MAEVHVQSVDIAGLCVTVADLERKARKSQSGRVLIESYQVETLAKVAGQLDDNMLAACRAARP